MSRTIIFVFKKYIKKQAAFRAGAQLIHSLFFI